LTRARAHADCGRLHGDVGAPSVRVEDRGPASPIGNAVRGKVDGDLCQIETSVFLATGAVPSGATASFI